MSYAPAAMQILDVIRSASHLSDEEFDRLVLALFQDQVESNTVLRGYAMARGHLNPTHWTEMPALPTSAFKRADICSFPRETAITHFRTSGTTEGESGRHFFQSLKWYEAAILPNFCQHLLPATTDVPIRMLILTQPPQEAPNSSLVHMMETVRREYGTSESDYYLRGGELEFDRTLEDLRQSQASGAPVFLLGTAFSFVFLMDKLWAGHSCPAANPSNKQADPYGSPPPAVILHRSASPIAGQECPAHGEALLPLPPGSRIMETGGFKGRTRELPRDEFYPLLSRTFGVPLSSIVNEYGMTELSSQFYDVSLTTGSPSAWKAIPPWCRVRAVDPLSNKIQPDGTEGLLRIWDLANVGSACVLQTEDVGVTLGDQFQVFGRIAEASPRGCSLGVEDLLRQL